MELEPKRILVVDDEPLVLNAVKAILGYEGHIVEAVSDATKALAVFEPDKYNLVITDYVMPGMKGIVLAEVIRTLAPKQPIILLTAHGEMIEKTLRDVTCFDCVLTKPFRLEVLRKAVTQFAR